MDIVPLFLQSLLFLWRLLHEKEQYNKIMIIKKIRAFFFFSIIHVLINKTKWSNRNTPSAAKSCWDVLDMMCPAERRPLEWGDRRPSREDNSMKSGWWHLSLPLAAWPDKLRPRPTLIICAWGCHALAKALSWFYHLWAEAAGHPPAFSWPYSRRLLCLCTAVPGSSRSWVSRSRINAGPACTLTCFIASEAAQHQCWSMFWKPREPLLCMCLQKHQSPGWPQDHGAALPWPLLETWCGGLLPGHSQGLVGPPEQTTCFITLLDIPLNGFSPFPRTTHPDPFAAPFPSSLLPYFS